MDIPRDEVRSILRQVEEFHELLTEHHRLWEGSLERYVPRYPVRHIRKLEEQSAELAKHLGRVRPYLEHLYDKWILVNRMTGLRWNALDVAVSLNNVAIVKGDSIRAVLTGVQQVIGQLEAMEPEALIPPHAAPTDSVSPAVDNSQPTKTARLLARLKNNWIVAVIIVLTVGIIGLANVTDSLTTLWSFFASDAAIETDRTSQLSVNMKILNSAKQPVELYGLCAYYLVETDGIILAPYDKGRLPLRPLDGTEQGNRIYVEVNDTIWMTAEFPDPEMYQSLLARGVMNLHVRIWALGSDTHWTRIIPFETESLDGYYLEFDVGDTASMDP